MALTTNIGHPTLFMIGKVSGTETRVASRGPPHCARRGLASSSLASRVRPLLNLYSRVASQPYDPPGYDSRDPEGRILRPLGATQSQKDHTWQKGNEYANHLKLLQRLF